jgi:hypothetical protein
MRNAFGSYGLNEHVTDAGLVCAYIELRTELIESLFSLRDVLLNLIILIK